MNQIVIWEPRWHDRTVLVADWKLQEHNEVVIEHKEFPHPLYLSGERAKQFPLEPIKGKPMRAIPINELLKEVI